jgi:hypothetical protein
MCGWEQVILHRHGLLQLMNQVRVDRRHYPLLLLAGEVDTEAHIVPTCCAEEDGSVCAFIVYHLQGHHLHGTQTMLSSAMNEVQFCTPLSFLQCWSAPFRLGCLNRAVL